jgi:hypothetical protein
LAIYVLIEHIKEIRMRNIKERSEQRLDMKQETECRNYHRFRVRAGAIAALNDSKLGSITDISRDGLAFRYIDFGSEDKEECLESPTVSIVNDAGFALHDVPCKIITDDNSQPEYSFSTLRMNKCRLQFVNLTPEQQAQLDYFIANFSKGQVDELGDLPGDH